MEKAFQALLDRAPVCLFAVDTEGTVFVADGCGRLPMGKTAAGIGGRSAFDLFRGVGWLEDAIRGAIAGNAEPAVGGHDGASFVGEFSPVRSESGEIRGAAGWLFEVTEFEQRFRQLAEAPFEAIAVHERGRILFANLAFPSMFGYQPSEVIGMSATEFAAPESRDTVMRNILSNYPHPYEALGRRKDGTTFLGELRGKTINFQGRPVRVTAIRDITERRRFEEERAQLLEQEKAARLAAEEAERRARDALTAREEFLSIASHELRSPINALQLALQELNATAERGSSKTRAITELALRQGKRLTRLASDLLDVSRIHGGRLDLRPERVDLAEIVSEVSRGFRAEIELAGSKLELDADAPVFGVWDRARVDQVVANLLANAVKFGQGRPIEVVVRAEGDMAVLVVRDHGIGIPDNRRDKVFERFERGVSAEHYGGLGLGLYIVRHLVDAMGGVVNVDSEAGKGSAFTVSLPRGGDA